MTLHLLIGDTQMTNQNKTQEELHAAFIAHSDTLLKETALTKSGFFPNHEKKTDSQLEKMFTSLGKK